MSLTPDWTENYEGKSFKLLNFFPPAKWVPAYIRQYKGTSTEKDKIEAGGLPFNLRGDVIAGLAVGFMLVPQCIAFAQLAGLPVEVGLYSSFLPLVMYSLFGTIRQVQPGPTAVMSLLAGQALDSLGLDDPAERIAGSAVIAIFMGGISVLMGLLRFGFIVDFMSHSVMSAFCSAAGLTIATSQMKHMLGISMPRKKHWWETAWYLVSHLDEIDGPTLAMGLTVLGMLLTMKYWKSAGSFESRTKSLVWRWFPRDKNSAPFKVLKMTADMGSLVAVIIGWFWGLVYRVTDVYADDSPYLVGKIDAWGIHDALALPGSGLPAGVSIGALLSSAALMSVVGFLETIAVGGKFANAARYEYEPDQELIALGLANAGSALCSGYPVTGSFSRTAVNAMLGANSLVACSISSFLVLIASYTLLDVIGYLPKACLAPIIIQGAIGVISVHEFQTAFSASKKEFVVMLLTFVVSLWLTVKEGLATGFVLSIFKTMYELANPNIAVLGELEDGTWRDIRNFSNANILPNVVVVRLDARLSFANSRKLKEFCIRAVQVRENAGDKIEFLVIDGKGINHVDLTGCEVLEALCTSLEARHQKLILANLKGPVSRALELKHVPQEIKKRGGFLCTDMPQALDIISGRDAKGEKAFAKVNELSANVHSAQAHQAEVSKPHLIKALSHVTSSQHLDPLSPAGLPRLNSDPKSPTVRSPGGKSGSSLEIVSEEPTPKTPDGPGPSPEAAAI